MTGVRGSAFPRIYPCVVIAVTDGDTAKCFLDRGADDWFLTAVRISGVDTGIAARERSDPGGLEARNHLAGLLMPMMPATPSQIFMSLYQGKCASMAWDKYAGRIIGALWPPGALVDVGTQMIRDGYAAPWDGRGTQPKPPWPIP